MQNKKEKRGKKIKIISLVILIIACVFGGTSVFFAKNGSNILNRNNKVSGDNIEDENEVVEENVSEPEDEVEERINIAVMGTDKEGLRSDVDFVVSFDPATKQVGVVSVPRDTKFVMTDEMIQSLKDRGRDNFIPNAKGVRGQCKLTEVYAYAGEGYRDEFVVMALEEILGIEIHNYVTVGIEGFRNLVDAFGGVDMVVEDRLYYSDPYQDLYIDLYPGYQHLDGKKAEQLVRYREGYAQKDLKRIQVQQTFLKEFLKKVVSTENIIKNLPDIIVNAIKYVKTDISVKDALKYAKYVTDINVENVVMETIPGEGGSYFTPDMEGVKELSDRVFYGIQPEPEVIVEETPVEEIVETPVEEVVTEEVAEEKPAVVDTKTLKIDVSNGGITNGMAGKKRDMLIGKGYNVVRTSTYNGSDRERGTRIFVRSAEIGNDLIPYFVGARVMVDTTGVIGDDVDIKIILGLDEK